VSFRSEFFPERFVRKTPSRSKGALERRVFAGGELTDDHARRFDSGPRISGKAPNGFF